MTSDRPAKTLAMFLGSLARHEFISEYWGRRFWQSSSQELLDRQLFGLRDLVALVAFLRPCDGRIRLVEDGTQVWKGGLQQEGVFSQVTDALGHGMTVVLERLDLYWPPVVELCGDLAVALGCPVHANAYLTPGGAGGLDPHYDTHDVFVLQLEGEKSWTLGQIVQWLPTEQTASGRVTEMGDETHLTIRPGGVFYLPRGMAHRARSEAGHSLHLTIGCIPNTYGDELARLVASAAHQAPELRRSLAPTTASAETDQATLASLFTRLAGMVAEGGLLPRSGKPSQATGCYRLEDAESRFRVALDIAGLGSASTLGLEQPDEIELILDGDDGFVLRGGAREVRMDAAFLPAVQAIRARSGVFSLTDLSPDIEMEKAIRAVVRLLSSSFLRVVG